MGRGAKIFIRVVSIAFVVWVLMMGTLFYMFGRKDKTQKIDTFAPPWLEMSRSACDYEPVACASYLVGYLYTFPGFNRPPDVKDRLKNAVYGACLSDTPYLCQLAMNTHYGLLTSNDQIKYLASACRSGDKNACESTGPLEPDKWYWRWLRKVVVFFYRVFAFFTSRNWMQASLDQCLKGTGGACAAHMRAMWFTEREKLKFETPKIPMILESGCSAGMDSLCKFMFGLIDTERAPQLELQLMTKACSAGDLQACGEVKAATGH